MENPELGNLTQAQNELYGWIKDYIKRFQHSPSIRQMMQAMGLKSPAPTTKAKPSILTNYYLFIFSRYFTNSRLWSINLINYRNLIYQELTSQLFSYHQNILFYLLIFDNFRAPSLLSK